MLGNPVPGPIRPFGTAGSGFGVVAVFGAVDAFHPANNPDGTHGHQGIDIGNGTCGFPILAVEDGTIDEILTAPNGARIVRYQLTKYPGYQAALAHMDTFEVNLGQKVMRSQIIGHAGRSGTSACHLHGGMRLNGKEIDWWPLLDQNREDPMPGFKIGSNIGTFKFVGAHALISPTDPKVRYLQPANAGPFDVAASLDLKKPDGTPVDIDGNAPPLNQRDQVYLVDAPTFGVAAYALRGDGTFTPTTPAGHSDADLKQAAKDAANAVANASATEANKFT